MELFLPGRVDGGVLVVLVVNRIFQALLKALGSRVFVDEEFIVRVVTISEYEFVVDVTFYFREVVGAAVLDTVFSAKALFVEVVISVADHEGNGRYEYGLHHYEADQADHEVISVCRIHVVLFEPSSDQLVVCNQVRLQGRYLFSGCRGHQFVK